jgi:hypothetical protein
VVNVVIKRSLVVIVKVAAMLALMAILVSLGAVRLSVAF